MFICRDRDGDRAMTRADDIAMGDGEARKDRKSVV